MARWQERDSWQGHMIEAAAAAKTNAA